MQQRDLSNTDSDVIYRIARESLAQQIASKRESGELPEKAVDLYNKTQTILNTSDAEETFRTEFASMSQEERNAYSHLRLVDHLLNSVSYIIAERNKPDNGGYNAYNIEEMLHLARQSGYTAQDLENFFADVRIWKALTPHPTEHLNKKGIDSFRKLVSIADVPKEKREEILRQAIEESLSGTITPDRRATTFEETDFAVEQAKINRSGQRQMFRRINRAVGKAFDGYIISPDLKRTESSISTGLRVWHAGGDADGKANADRWALLYGMLALTRGAVEDHLDDIDQASKLIAEDSETSIRGTFQRAVEPFTFARQALEQLKDRIDLLERRFVTADEEGNKSLKETADYDVIKQEFANLFNGIKVGKINMETRQGFERELGKYFRFLSQTIENEEASEIMAESDFLMRQYGLSGAIIESRHNGVMLKQTMNNVFKDEEFVQSLNLPKEMAELLASKPLFAGVKKEEDGLSHDEQRKIIDFVVSNTTDQQRRTAFLRANPFDTDDNGYTVQTHEIFERYSLMALNPAQFGMAIVAEADELSPAYQRTLATPMGATTLLNTPLNEEYETIRDMPNYMEANHLNGGQKDISRRALDSTHGTWYGHNLVHGQMVPCSDSGKEYGLLVRVLETEGFRQTTAKSIGLGIATLIKRGNGLSLERGGGDDMVYTRYVAQILREYAEIRGKPLDPKDPQDRVLMQMASFFSNTEQGRAIRINSSTAEQISDDLCNKIGEMLGRRMELQGLVHHGTFIPPRGKYSAKTHQFLMETAYDMMQSYSAFRHAKSAKGEGEVLNNWATIVSNPSMAGAANSSARAQSKSSGKKSELLTAQRAIGCNIWIAMARTRHDGYFTSGEFLARMHQKYNDSALSKQDVKEFTLDSQWWRRMFFLRALMPAVRSDMAHGFEKLGMKDVTFDEAIKIGKSVHVDENGIFRYDDQDGRITEEQALQAAVFWDQARLVALTEAGLSIDEVNSPYNKSIDELVQTVRPKDNSTRILFGKRTLNRWPQLVEAGSLEKQALPELVLTDMYEDMIRDGKAIDDPTKRLATSAARAGQIPYIPTVMGDRAYGRRAEPIWDDALTAPPKNFRPELPVNEQHEQPDSRPG